MKITLAEWNEQYFASPRSRRQIGRYISDGKIQPPPIKVGRAYEIESTAILLTKENITDHNSLMERINEQKERVKNKRFAT